MADDKEIDRFMKDKADIRRVIAEAANKLIREWHELPEEREVQLQDALTSVLADITASVVTGTREPTREQFLDFMGNAFDKAITLKKALEDGAFV